jgi:hypothetical protein
VSRSDAHPGIDSALDSALPIDNRRAAAKFIVASRDLPPRKATFPEKTSSIDRT